MEFIQNGVDVYEKIIDISTEKKRSTTKSLCYHSEEVNLT